MLRQLSSSESEFGDIIFKPNITAIFKLKIESVIKLNDMCYVKFVHISMNLMRINIICIKMLMF